MGPTGPAPWQLLSWLFYRYLVCSGQAELWDWTTSILKAQVGAGWPCHPAGLGWDGGGLAGAV